MTWDDRAAKVREMIDDLGRSRNPIVKLVAWDLRRQQRRIERDMARERDDALRRGGFIP